MTNFYKARKKNGCNRVQMNKGKNKGMIRKASENAGSSLLGAGKEAKEGAVIESAIVAAMSLS